MVEKDVILQVKDLHFNYEKNQILKGIDLEVQKGSIYCIFGPNGCGKSTLLNCLLGLNNYTQGNIYIKNKNLQNYSLNQRAKQLSYVSQKSDKTFAYSCEEIVLMGRSAYARIFSSPSKEDILIAQEALKSVGMFEFRNKAFTNLSGGETQLIKIARAIAQDTDIIVFDEPTSHLDFRHELNVLKYIAKIVKQNGKTAIMATHFPNHALYFESLGIDTKVAIMEKGVLRVCGTPSNALNQENMANIFKVQTKEFKEVVEEKEIKYIVPVDFTKDGEWK